MIKEIRSILMQIEKSTANIGSVKLYAFGSATRRYTSPNDIDILVIYNQPDQPKLLRGLFENSSYIPVDIIFMTKDEEKETDFIRSQKCIPLFQQ